MENFCGTPIFHKTYRMHYTDTYIYFNLKNKEIYLNAGKNEDYVKLRKKQKNSNFI